MPEDIIAHPPIRLDQVMAWTLTASVPFQDERSSKVSVETADHRIKVETPILIPALRDSIGFEIGAVPGVLAVYASVQDRACYVWTIVEASEPELRKRIYAKEKALIGRFEQIDFEFNVMSSRGQDPKHLTLGSSASLAFLRA